MPKASLSQTQSDETSRQAAAELLLIGGHLTSALQLETQASPSLCLRLSSSLRGKEPTAGSRPGCSPRLGKIPWRRERLPTPVLWPESSTDCIVHGVPKSWTRLRDVHFHFGKGHTWHRGHTPSSTRQASPSQWTTHGYRVLDSQELVPRAGTTHTPSLHCRVHLTATLEQVPLYPRHRTRTSQAGLPEATWGDRVRQDLSQACPTSE